MIGRGGGDRGRGIGGTGGIWRGRGGTLGGGGGAISTVRGGYKNQKETGARGVGRGQEVEEIEREKRDREELKV